MTELEKIERAKMYMDKLAHGINPIDDTKIPESDLINNVRLSRCFFFISDILRQVIENGGIATQKKGKKKSFALSQEKRDAFEFSDTPITISEIAKRLNALINVEAMLQMKYSSMTAWLVEIGMLSILRYPDGKTAKRPTPSGSNIGISVEERTGANGNYQVVVYDRNAQHFILDNLDAILNAENVRYEMQGQPWNREQDERLADLYRKGITVNDISTTLKRNTSSIRARLKKLGLIPNASDGTSHSAERVHVY